MTPDESIRTGIESDDRADATAQSVDPDVWAFADDGEHATTWAIERVDDTTVRVEIHRHEAGLDDVDGPPLTFNVDADTSTETFARELAESDPEKVVDLARAYWA